MKNDQALIAEEIDDLFTGIQQANFFMLTSSLPPRDDKSAVCGSIPMTATWHDRS